LRIQTTTKYSHISDLHDTAGNSSPVADENNPGGILRADAKTRALVILPDFRSNSRRDGSSENTAGGKSPLRTAEVRLEEAVGLALAIDLEIAETLIVPLNKPRPATLFGTGKVDEIKGLIAARDVVLVIIDHALSPIQQRNLERAWECKVLDRTGLILEIFSLRAQTREGRLQVQLAHLEYEKSRLVRSWTHLERQRGGLGTVGGPGETQIESDRRQIQDKITKIKKQLETVTRTRGLHRQSRRKIPYPIVALVGYTNAGKSTLFNKLAGADVMVADMLFATLDPTMREIRLTNGRRIIMSDTVGFISQLPTHLIAAFRATLEEVLDADLIIHVRDIAAEETQAQALDVEQVLETLGVGRDNSERQLIEVWNKIDLVGQPDRDAIIEQSVRNDQTICVSAQTGEGMDRLVELIDRQLSRHHSELDITLDVPGGKTLHWIHQNCDVIHRHDHSDGSVELKLRVAPEKQAGLDRILSQIHNYETEV